MSDLARSSGTGLSSDDQAASRPAPSGVDPSREAEATETDRPFGEVFSEAYDWQVDEEGYLWGLVAGDMGYDKTDTKLTALVFSGIETEWARYHESGASDWAVSNAFNVLVRALHDVTAPAQEIGARSAEAQGGSAVGESPVGQQADAPDPKREGEMKKENVA